MSGHDEKPVQLLCLGSQTDAFFTAVFSAATKSDTKNFHLVLTREQLELKGELGNTIIRDHSEIKEEKTVNIPLFDTDQIDTLLLLPKSIDEFEYLCIYALSRIPKPPHTLNWVALINLDREKMSPHHNEIARKYSISLIQGRFSDKIILTLLKNIIDTFRKKPQDIISAKLNTNPSEQNPINAPSDKKSQPQDLINAQLNMVPSERKALQKNILSFLMGKHGRLGKRSVILPFSRNQLYDERDLLPIIFNFSYGSLWRMPRALQTKQKIKLANEEKTEKTVVFKA